MLITCSPVLGSLVDAGLFLSLSVDVPVDCWGWGRLPKLRMHCCGAGIGASTEAVAGLARSCQPSVWAVP